jgi:ABC-type maltose transport system permease subunit
MKKAKPKIKVSEEPSKEPMIQISVSKYGLYAIIEAVETLRYSSLLKLEKHFGIIPMQIWDLKKYLEGIRQTIK